MARLELPRHGRDREEILDELKGYGARDPHYKEGRVWSLVYYLGEEHSEFLQKAYGAYFSANGLNPTAFQSLKRLENEVIDITASLLHGTDEVCGVMTSGGTESCLLAVKTYRDWARQVKGIKKPKMILPETAHVAWEKGAEYFGVKAVHAPLDKNFRVDVGAVKRLTDRNTIMILGSAPEYPHGIIDPIAELGEFAQSKGIPLHVDACVGGYILPFIEKLGHPVPLWDYRIPGVTSISADTHKYAFAAKGASTITYRSMDYMKHQMFVHQDWPGGVFASPALLGTRPGGAYAAAWASLQLFGEEGYKEITKITLDVTQKLIRGINEITGLEIIGEPLASLFAYRSCDPEVNVFAVGDQMETRGWHIDRLQKPEGLHAMVTPGHAESYSRYLDDLSRAVDHVRAHPELAGQGGAATYGMIANIPFRGMVKKQVLDMFSEMYRPGGKMIDMGNSSLTDEGGSTATASGLPPFLDKIVSAYVSRKQKRNNQLG